MICKNCQSEVAVPAPKRPAPSVASSGVPSKVGSGIRRVCLLGLLTCFVVGALTAIYGVLISEMGSFQGKILLTTLSIGAYSLIGLCCALLVEKGQYDQFGRLGLALSAVGALFAVLTNWGFSTGLEVLIKGRVLFLILGIAFAHSSLLLAIDTNHPLVRSVRRLTLWMIGSVTALLLVITLSPLLAFWAWSFLVIFGILDLLGTLATPILHLALRNTQGSSSAS